jgi:hypothetical protein
MPFRVKNLMIQVLPEGGEKSLLCSSFPFISRLPPITGLFCKPVNEPDTVSDPVVLTTLKEQLQEALKAVEAGEDVINERMRIETPEEAVELEKYLTTALEEVRSQKQALQNKPDEGQG